VTLVRPAGSELSAISTAGYKKDNLA
jgi:hypothetical protein